MMFFVILNSVWIYYPMITGGPNIICRGKSSVVVLFAKTSWIDGRGPTATDDPKKTRKVE